MAIGDEVLSRFQPKVQEKKQYGQKLKIGIIGTGWIAEAHIESYHRMPDVEVVALADLVEGKAARFKEHYHVDGARLYNDHRSMLEAEDLDAVSVCTYNMAHAECTIDALNAGVHVLLEKPMCVTLEEAVSIMRAEKQSGKILTVGFQPRMDENMQMIKRIVQSGTLGKVYYIQTGGGRRRGIPGSTFIEKKTAGLGALGDIGCYSLDMVLNAIGYPKPLTVSGYTSSYFGTSPDYQPPEEAARFSVDDFAAAFIRMEGDIVIDFRISWAMHMDTPGDTIILGTKGALRIPSTECWNGTVGGQMVLYHDVAGEQVQTPIPIIQGKETGLFDRKIRSFLDAVHQNGQAPVPTSQIIINQAIIDGIAKSAELNKEIEIVIPEI